MPSPLTNFAAAAESYIAFINSFANARPDKLYTALESHLADLHAAILPVVAGSNEKRHRKLEKIGMSHKQWSVIANHIAEHIAPEVGELFELHNDARPIEELHYQSPAMRADMLFDDLADIYRDIHTGLTLWKLDTPESKIEASWQWRYNYDIHWGNHLFVAALTIHEIRYRLNKA